MPNEGSRERFAKYFNDHPTEAERLRISIRETLDTIANSGTVMESLTKQWEETRTKIIDSLKLPLVHPSFFTQLQETLEALYPRNWPRPSPDFERIEDVLGNDGIPIVHVPRSEIVQAIVDAADYEARIAIIDERADDVVEDCKTLLARDFHEEVEKQQPLAQRAVDAYQAGHFEAAQALAVNVCDTYFKKLFKGLAYKKMVQQLAIEKSDDASFAWAYNVHYALVPGAQFLTEWWPDKGGEPPTKLSRHVSIHNASTDQMTKLNATVAIMLVTSITAAINYALDKKGGSLGHSK
jgi:hypothetical protein